MKRHQEENPSNARVFINYDDKKNPVKFEYPSRSSAFSICFRCILCYWMIVSGVFTGASFILASVFPKLYENKFIYYLGFGGMISYVWIFVFMFIPSLLITSLFVSNKWLLKKMPSINMNLALFPSNGYYYAKVEAKDMKDNKFEIPLFDNIFMDYDLYGDFKNIQKVNITEYDFKKKWKNILGKLKERQQDGNWKVEFIFKQKPEKGYMEIRFK